MGILDQFSLKGKVALVTGAARGLGQGMAIGLAEAGADLALLDRETSSETKEIIQALGRKAHSLQFDLSGMNPDRADELIADVVSRLGRLDILVNNAGIIRRAPAMKMTEKDWKEVLDINLNSAFYLSQAAARHFHQNKQTGKIIQVASMLSFQGGILVPSYTAAKSAILGITRALANEWAPLGINVNAIAPGYMVTEVTAGIRFDVARNAAMLERIPAARWGQPEDLKGAVVFLASSASDYMHGAVVPVDGGWLGR